jgi:hypothetical protein
MFHRLGSRIWQLEKRHDDTLQNLFNQINEIKKTHDAIIEYLHVDPYNITNDGVILIYNNLNLNLVDLTYKEKKLSDYTTEELIFLINQLYKDKNRLEFEFIKISKQIKDQKKNNY